MLFSLSLSRPHYILLDDAIGECWSLLISNSPSSKHLI